MGLKLFFKNHGISMTIVVIAALAGAIATFCFDSIIDHRTANREFAYNFSRTFFDNTKYRSVSIALEEQYLYGKPILRVNRGSISDYDLDDYLSLIYDMYYLYEDDYISREMFIDSYAYYACIAYNSAEIQSYRQKLLKEGFSSAMAFGYLDDMADDLKIRNINCKIIE